MPSEQKDVGKSAGSRPTPRLSKQMIDAIVAYGDDRTESNFERLKDMIVQFASRRERSRERSSS